MGNLGKTTTRKCGHDGFLIALGDWGLAQASPLMQSLSIRGNRANQSVNQKLFLTSNLWYATILSPKYKEEGNTTEDVQNLGF